MLAGECTLRIINKYRWPIWLHEILFSWKGLEGPRRGSSPIPEVLARTFGEWLRHYCAESFHSPWFCAGNNRIRTSQVAILEWWLHMQIEQRFGQSTPFVEAFISFQDFSFLPLYLFATSPRSPRQETSSPPATPYLNCTTDKGSDLRAWLARPFQVSGALSARWRLYNKVYICIYIKRTRGRHVANRWIKLGRRLCIFPFGRFRVDEPPPHRVVRHKQRAYTIINKELRVN